MTIEIHQPELEALIEQRMASGRFRNVEEVLLEALQSSPEDIGQGAPGRTLAEVFAMVRGTADDLDVSRDPSPGRPIDLS